MVFGAVYDGRTKGWKARRVHDLCIVAILALKVYKITEEARPVRARWGGLRGPSGERLYRNCYDYFIILAHFKCCRRDSMLPYLKA